MKKLAVVVSLAIITGCGGMARQADPVPAYEYGDSGKNCAVLQTDLENCKTEIARLNDRRNGKIGANAAIGIVSAVIFWPGLFLMDFSDVDVDEIEAQRQRYKSLALICREKNCDFEITELATKPVKKEEINR